MYYELVFVMVSAPLKLSLASRVMLHLQGLNRSISGLQSTCSITFAMALFCLSVVTVLVPERPDQLASICEKHNPAVACRVW